MNRPNPYTQRKLAEARQFPPHDGLLAAVNVGFHETYTRVVEQVLAELGDAVPVIVLMGDDATLLRDGEFGLAALNMAASNVFGLLMVWTGYVACKAL